MVQYEYIHDGSFEFETGETMEGLGIVYHTSPDPYVPGNDSRKVIWICHALTANSDAEDWWPAFVGEGKLFDTRKYFVVCVNMLGSPYGSGGPASPRGAFSSGEPVPSRSVFRSAASVCPGEQPDGEPPACTDGLSGEKTALSGSDGARYYFDFPRITVRDIVKANILVRKHLGIRKIDMIIGGSIGGFQALEWCIMEPDVISEAVFIACNARVTPWMTAYNESQRMALEADSSFRECGSLKGGAAGLRCARSIALISYRSYDGYNMTQGEESDDTLFAGRAGSYQRYQGRKLSDRFDAYSYWYLTWTVDSHNVGRGRGGVEAALSGIRAHCTVIGIDSDCLFPIGEQRYIAEHIPGAEFHEVVSRFGHDGFLLEYQQISEIVSPVLGRLETGS